MPDTRAGVLTVGHGTSTSEEFAELVTAANVRRVVDVRTFPGSRRNPQHGQDQMSVWLPEVGVEYSWMPALGGRRRPVEGSPHVVWRHPSFRAYADHMESDEFRQGIDDLLSLGSGSAVMCSEAVWWRCHRRLIADHLVLVRGLEVVHLMHDGRRHPHRPTDGVRRDGDRLVYDVVAAEVDATGTT